MQPIGYIRLIGHTDKTGTEQYNVALGNRRAQAVKEELERLLRDDILSGRTRIAILVEPSPGATEPTAANSTSEGRARNRRVEVFVAPPEPPLPPPPPPPVLTPPPPPPETAEERIQRILRTLPPAPPPRRSFTQMFWQRADEQLDAVMSRLNVPRSLRGPIRDGAHAAITRGSEALWNQIIDATGLPSGAQDAIRSSGRALLDVPIR
jgi:hypothetical protein